MNTQPISFDDVHKIGLQIAKEHSELIYENDELKHRIEVLMRENDLLRIRNEYILAKYKQLKGNEKNCLKLYLHY